MDTSHAPGKNTAVHGDGPVLDWSVATVAFMPSRGAVGRMSLAAETRRAVDSRPFLRAGLRAGVVNYTAAARTLPVDGETDAVATALRRYADELPAYEPVSREVTVRMQSGIGALDDDDRGLLTVGDATFGPCDGDRTAIIATSGVDPLALATAIRALSIADVDPVAAAVGDGTMMLVVDRRDGATALRTVENALEGTADR